MRCEVVGHKVAPIRPGGVAAYLLARALRRQNLVEAFKIGRALARPDAVKLVYRLVPFGKPFSKARDSMLTEADGSRLADSEELRLAPDV